MPVELSVMLDKARKEYLDYQDQQKALLKKGEADQEWVAMMETVADETEVQTQKFLEAVFPGFYKTGSTVEPVALVAHGGARPHAPGPVAGNVHPGSAHLHA